MTTAPDTIFAACVMSAEGTDAETVDVRTLSAERLEALGNEAAAAGDATLSAVICMMQAGAEPIRIEGLATIRAMMGGDATEVDAEIMLDLLRTWGHITDGWLCITDALWADLDSEAANLAASR
jgi:hypothetical protein